MSDRARVSSTHAESACGDLARDDDVERSLARVEVRREDDAMRVSFAQSVIDRFSEGMNECLCIDDDARYRERGDGETDARWSFHSLARRTVTSNARSNARDDS